MGNKIASLHSLGAPQVGTIEMRHPDQVAFSRTPRSRSECAHHAECSLLFPALERSGLEPSREAPPTPLSRSEWCLCQSAAVYGIMSYNPASLLSYPVISNVEN